MTGSSGAIDDATRRKLAAIAAFLPIFEAPGFVFGRWSEPKRENGVVQMPYVNLSDEASGFIKVVYENKIMRPFDWGEWIGTEEACGLRDEPDILAAASADQIAKLLTVVICQDRFVEGALLGAFENGFLVAVLRRANVLAQSGTD